MILDVAGNIRKIRIARHLSQDQLAELACLNRVTIAKYEAGKVEPGAQALSRIANALDVSVDQLLWTQYPNEHVEDPYTVRERPAPKTVEARILSAGIDRMPEAERERALNLMRQIFVDYADYFEDSEGESDDT